MLFFGVAMNCLALQVHKKTDYIFYTQVAAMYTFGIQ